VIDCGFVKMRGSILKLMLILLWLYQCLKHLQTKELVEQVEYVQEKHTGKKKKQ